MFENECVTSSHTIYGCDYLEVEFICEYSEFHSQPDIDFFYTGLNPAQGPRGKRPS